MGGATAAGGLGQGLQLGGTFMQMNAEENAADAKYGADRDNAMLARMRAADALQRGAYLAGAQRMKGSQMVGAQRAGYGASGVDANVGTPAQVQASTSALAELSATQAKNNAAREAFGHQLTARQYDQQAAVDDGLGDQEAEGTMLGGMGSVAAYGGRSYDSTYGKG